MTKILVTGGAGFIGSHIVRNFVSKGTEVRVFDDFSRGSNSRLQDLDGQIEIIEGDIRNSKDLVKAARDIDTLVHLAFVNGTENFYKFPNLVLDVAIEGTLAIRDAIQANSINDVMLASSSEVYQVPSVFPTPEEIEFSVPSLENPRFSYGLGKIIQEFYLYHLSDQLENLTIFRPHNVYGTDMGNLHVIPELFNKALIARTSKGKLEIQGNGTQTRSFCHISDFISAFDLIYSKRLGKEVFNIGTSEEVTISHLAQEIARITEIELSSSNSSLPVGGTNRRVPDITKIENLGFRQQVSLNNGLRMYYENLKKSEA
jgi:nucleoside-diphosphate-sugar epimerase